MNIKEIFFTVLLSCLFLISHAQTTWDGSTDSGWGTVTNGTVIIDGSGSVTSHVDHHAVAYNLTISGSGICITGAELEISRKPKTEAIQNVITESWLSPGYKNAERFLDWAISMPYYQLKYSDNQQMITAITKLFSDEE